MNKNQICVHGPLPRCLTESSCCLHGFEQASDFLARSPAAEPSVRGDVEGEERRSRVAGEAMTMTKTTEQKRRTDGFLGCAGGTLVGGGRSCGGVSNKRAKIGCGGGAAKGGEVSIYVKEKDKIGERVSALQQLVSPFGKTDTASVLQEAMAYIKFLHEQLQVLSAPYIRSTQTGRLQGSDNSNLRSRGLCLVPVARTSGIAHSNGADIWAPISANKA